MPQTTFILGVTTNATVTLAHWIAFAVFVVAMLVLDLCVFHRKSHKPSLRESTFWSVFWIGLGLAFNVLIGLWLGHRAAGAFLLGYVVEKSLSMDNVFVFLVIFSYFGVRLEYQYRVLFWGILGAVVLRLAFVLGAAALIGRFDWIMWLFGAFLVYTAFKLATHDAGEVHPEKNVVLKLAQRFFPVAKGQYGAHFFVRENGRLMVTHLFLVLVVIESSDVMFAVDSVPAIFGVVGGWLDLKDPAFTFIVFTSNVFAILGLRALYFLLAGFMDTFRYLSYGLSGVLGFVGAKMIVDYWAPDVIHWLPKQLGVAEQNERLVVGIASLIVIFTILGISIVVSVVADRREDAKKRGEESEE